MIEIKLKKIREQRGWTKYKMSAFLGIKAAYGEYHKIEVGMTNPGLDKALKIARKLKMPVEKIWVLKN